MKSRRPSVSATSFTGEVERLAPIHDGQLLTYLRLGGWKVGLLINLNVPLLDALFLEQLKNFAESDDLVMGTARSTRLCNKTNKPTGFYNGACGKF